MKKVYRSKAGYDVPVEEITSVEIEDIKAEYSFYEKLLVCLIVIGIILETYAMSMLEKNFSDILKEALYPNNWLYVLVIAIIILAVLGFVGVVSEKTIKPQLIKRVIMQYNRKDDTVLEEIIWFNAYKLKYDIEHEISKSN